MLCILLSCSHLVPSSIYSWSLSHILEHEFFCLSRLGSSGSKEIKWIWVFLSNFWGWFFQLFVVEKNSFFKYCSLLTKKLHKINFKKFFKWILNWLPLTKNCIKEGFWAWTGNVLRSCINIYPWFFQQITEISFISC